jgi:8-oxo-dGTP pyrophosphatase MutT (NUDIX family)
MYLTIYFGDKPVFLCDDIDDTIHEFMHHPDAVFIDEVSPRAIKSLLHEIAKPEFHAGILFNADLEELKKIFLKQFILVQTGGGLVVNEKKEVLLIFRRGKWDLPKGKLDKGETLEGCAVREVEEETGLSGLELLKLLTKTYHTYVEFGKHILKESWWYRMKCSSKQSLVPQTEEDITDIRWVKKGELGGYTSNTFPTIVEVLGYL